VNECRKVTRIFSVAEITPIDRGNGIRSIPLVGEETGSERLLTGYTIVPPGGKIPFHTHSSEECIVVLEGDAAVDVDGRRTRLRPLDATYVSGGVEHRFVNLGQTDVRILWIYSDIHITRTFTESGETSGHLDRYRAKR